MEKLLASRLYSINFSLDSMDPEDYPKIRRGAKPLAEVLASIREFAAAAHARRSDSEMLISFVLMKRNIDTLFAAIIFAAEVGIDIVQGSHLIVMTPDMAEQSLIPEPRLYAEKYSELMNFALAKNVTLALPAPIDNPLPRRGHAPCHLPWEGAVVLGNSDVLVCCMPGTKVGNLHQESLAQIWNGPALRAFRARVNSQTPPEPCNVCPVFRFPNNYASYAPGLTIDERDKFEARCVAASERQRTPAPIRGPSL